MKSTFPDLLKKEKKSRYLKEFREATKKIIGLQASYLPYLKFLDVLCTNFKNTLSTYQ